MSGRSGLISRSCQIEQAAGRTLDALFGYLMFIFELCIYHICIFSNTKTGKYCLYCLIHCSTIFVLSSLASLLPCAHIPGLCQISESRSDFFAELAQNISYEASDQCENVQTK